MGDVGHSDLHGGRKKGLNDRRQSMGDTLPAVSIIIPTLCETRRRDSLGRAIASLASQEGVTTEIIVVVNGDRYDPALLSELERRSDVHLHRRADLGLPGALRVGRSLVETPFFSFLDDDDEYLPGALRSRVAPMLEDDAVDFVVGNGLRGPDGSTPSGRQSVEDPLRELLDNNWLTSCGGLFRTSSIGVGYFDDVPAFAEWTYLAYKLFLSRKAAFVDHLGHRIHDTESSLSKSANYIFGQVAALESILKLKLPPDMRRALRERYGAALHVEASCRSEMAERRSAWKAHLKSLLQPKGMRYVLYTRKLLVNHR